MRVNTLDHREKARLRGFAEVELVVTGLQGHAQAQYALAGARELARGVQAHVGRPHVARAVHSDHVRHVKVFAAPRLHHLACARAGTSRSNTLFKGI